MIEDWKKWLAPLIIGIILVALFISWVWGQLSNLPIAYVGKGEKARFIRYLSCAAAMCSAWHQTDDDACHSGEVMSQGLEYEGDTLIKGCKELCEEIRDREGGTALEHYCGEDYAFNFTFRDYVNFTSLDIRNIASFRDRIIHSSCYECPGLDLHYIIIIAGLIPTRKQFAIATPWGRWFSEGYLCSNSDPINDCTRPDKYDKDVGVIWLPHNDAQNWCNGNYVYPTIDSWAYCEFDETTPELWIWPGPDLPHTEKYWEWETGSWLPIIGGSFFTSCGYRADAFGTEYWCPQIFIYDSHPSNCP